MQAHKRIKRSARQYSLVMLTLALLAMLPAAPTVPVNAAVNEASPVLEANNGLAIGEGDRATIFRSALRITDADTAPSDIIYRLTAVPRHGTLALAGQTRPLALGDTFTQTFIDDGQLVYQHDGSQTGSDSFEYLASDGPLPRITRASVTSDGQQVSAFACCGNISPNGRYVDFNGGEGSPGFVDPDTRGTVDNFVHDRLTGKTTRIPFGLNGEQPNSNSFETVYSADGRYIAFESWASNLVATDPNPNKDIFLLDQQANTITRVSTPSGGSEIGVANDPSISADGQSIAFTTSAPLTANDANNGGDVYLHAGGQTSLVSVGLNGQAAGACCVVVSADARLIGFSSSASNLVPNDTNNTQDAFMRDRTTGQTTRISLAEDGSQAQGTSSFNAFSADGRYVLFTSDAPNVVPNDTNGVADVFVRDLVTGQVSRVSLMADGTQATSRSGGMRISTDGRYVVVASDAPLTPNDTYDGPDIFVVDRTIGQIRLATINGNGVQKQTLFAGGGASDDARFITFSSTDGNLVPDDTNNIDDQFVADMGIARTFSFSIVAANDAPTIAPIAPVTIVKDGISDPIALTIGDEETSADALTISVSSSNPGLVPNDAVFLGGAGANRTLAIQPRSGQTGTANITVRVTDGQATTSTSFPVEVNVPSATPSPWLVLLYLAGDDVAPGISGQVSLNTAITELHTTLNGMPPNSAMRLVVLLDGSGPNDSKLYVREPGAQGLSELTAPQLPNWYKPELDTGDVSTLRQFISWARSAYPGSPHTFLSIVDHGGGWAADQGEVGQPRGAAMVRAGGWTGMSLDASSNNGAGSSLSTRELRQSLEGQGRFDVLFLDACLMSMIETATEVQPFADYLVAGQNILWSQLRYDRYFDVDALTPATTPQQLAQTIVERYNQPARADEPFAIAAIDLNKVPDLVAKTDALAAQIMSALPPPATEYSWTAPALPSVPTDNTIRKVLTSVYSATQKFDYDSNLSLDETEAYVDLADFTAKLSDVAATITPTLSASARDLHSAIVGSGTTPGVVIANNVVSGVNYVSQTQWDLSGAHGLSIYLPLGELDCRPTGPSDALSASYAPCLPPQTADGFTPERQLRYYANPSQFAFTRSAPHWANLLLRLEANTPLRDRGFGSPFPARSQQWQSFLPLVTVAPSHALRVGIAVNGSAVELALPRMGDASEVRMVVQDRRIEDITTSFWVDLALHARTGPARLRMKGDIAP